MTGIAALGRYSRCAQRTRGVGGVRGRDLAMVYNAVTGGAAVIGQAIHDLGGAGKPQARFTAYE